MDLRKTQEEANIELENTFNYDLISSAGMTLLLNNRSTHHVFSFATMNIWVVRTYLWYLGPQYQKGVMGLLQYLCDAKYKQNAWNIL